MTDQWQDQLSVEGRNQFMTDKSLLINGLIRLPRVIL